MNRHRVERAAGPPPLQAMSDCADIAFIKIGDFSQINAGVCAMLAREFPELTLHVVDVNDLVQSPPRLLSHWGSALAEYGLRAASSRWALESCAQRTPRYFKAARALLSKALSRRRWTS